MGWLVTERERAALTRRLIKQSCLKQGIAPQALTLHSDCGAPMTSKCTAQPLANPFSEAQFKTLKYHSGFPGRLADITTALAFGRSVSPSYNTENRHAGTAMLTPDDVHHSPVYRANFYSPGTCTPSIELRYSAPDTRSLPAQQTSLPQLPPDNDHYIHSPHPWSLGVNRTLTTQDVSWFLDLHEKQQLNFDPPYQRRSVWSPSRPEILCRHNFEQLSCTTRLPPQNHGPIRAPHVSRCRR